MYQIAICDDDIRMRRFLHSAVDEAGIHCTVKEFSNGTGLIQDDQEYDILFLDIDMPVVNGIEAAKRIRRKDRKVKIVYVTGYQDYMQRSFEVHPFSFLVKPVKKETIIKQIREALLYSREEEKADTLRLETMDGMEEIAVSDIYYLEYQNRKLRLVMKYGECMIRGKVSEFSKKMIPYGFASPHKSFVVNLYHVKAIRGYDIFMMNGDLIPLSQKRSTEFRGLLGKYQADRL
ncbi:MAG: response regulator transcription factor [Ruminococcus sp.]|nr:response regulator transcription factor [Ruminococcus sp.]